MAIDFSSLQATPAHTGQIDFSAIGGIPAVGQDESTDDTTSLGAAGRGAAGMIPLGTQAYAATAGMAEKKPYLQERQELEKEIESDKENHGVARLAGQAAGLVAPAIVTGGASAPESLAGAAGEGAAMGAGFGAGNAIDTLAGGGSGAKAAGDVALGAGLGAAGGAVGQKVAGALSSSIPGIENYAAKKAAQSVGMGSDELGRMGQQEIVDTGKMLMDKGIVRQGASTQEMFDQAKGLQEQYGDQIGQIGNQARDLGLSTDTKPLLEALESKYKAADALQNPDERKAALFYKRGMSDILAMSRQNVPDVLATEGVITPSDITFDQLQRLKKSYGNSAFESGAVKNPAAADVYSTLSAGQKAIVNNAKDNPDLPAQLKDAMTGYSKMHPVVEGLQNVLGRERAGNMPAKGFGMMGKLVGQLPGQDKPAINALTSLGLLGAGHPMWAMGAATATLQNPRAMSGMAQSVANAVPGMAEKLPMAASQAAGAAAPTDINVNHPALAPWKPTFQQNAAKAQNSGEKEKANAVTDFILSQRDPAYAAAKQKASDEPQPSQPEKEAAQPENIGMSDGGVVPEEGESKITEPIPAMGSTLEGFGKMLGAKTPVPMEPGQTQTRLNGGKPFNDDLASKLKAFLDSQKETDDAQSR